MPGEETIIGLAANTLLNERGEEQSINIDNNQVQETLEQDQETLKIIRQFLNGNDSETAKNLVRLLDKKIEKEQKARVQEEIDQNKQDLMHYAFPLAMFLATIASGAISQLVDQLSPLSSEGLEQFNDPNFYKHAFLTSAAGNVAFSLIFVLASKLHAYLNKQELSELDQDPLWKTVTTEVMNYVKGTLTFSLFPVFAQLSQAMMQTLRRAVSTGELSEEFATLFADCITSTLLTIGFKGLDLADLWSALQIFFGLTASQITEHRMGSVQNYWLTLVLKALSSGSAALVVALFNSENHITQNVVDGVRSVGSSIGNGLNSACMFLRGRFRSFFGNGERTPLLADGNSQSNYESFPNPV